MVPGAECRASIAAFTLADTASVSRRVNPVVEINGRSESARLAIYIAPVEEQVLSTREENMLIGEEQSFAAERKDSFRRRRLR